MERDRGTQDGGGGEKMRGNRGGGEGVGSLRGPEGTLPCGGTGRKGGSGKERPGVLRVTQLGMSE